MIKRIEKPVRVERTEKTVKLPQYLRKAIQVFWSAAILETPTLYDGEDFAVEETRETEDEIVVKIIKTNYSHYLYDERIGVDDEKYRCISPWVGILFLTNDGYWVIGQMDKGTSSPNTLQITGGGIDEKDISDDRVNLVQNLKRELKEEVNLDLDRIDYRIQYIELPSRERNAFGFIAIGKLDMSRDALQKHFERYIEHLSRNNLEIEFSKLCFLKKGNAIQELDTYDNPKREYLRELLIEVDRRII